MTGTRSRHINLLNSHNLHNLVRMTGRRLPLLEVLLLFVDDAREHW
jgi:hypothetical protein